MKNSIKSVAAIVLALSLTTTQLFAKENTISVLSDSAWNEIEETVEVENMLFEADLHTLKLTGLNTLSMDFNPGDRTNLVLNAPVKGAEEVGIVVYDNAGVVVYNATGTYNDVKTLHFEDYYKWDMDYVVKIYSETEVFEAKVQVVYR